MDAKTYAGLKLLGNMVRHPLWDKQSSARCTALRSDRRVEVEGCDRTFDPDELELVGEIVSVPVLGKVGE